MPMMWGFGYGWNWGTALVAALYSLLWVALLGVLIWALLRWISNRSQGGASTGSGQSELPALEILKQRYARGEIDETTYEQMRERLEGTDSAMRRFLTPSR